MSSYVNDQPSLCQNKLFSQYLIDNDCEITCEKRKPPRRSLDHFVTFHDKEGLHVRNLKSQIFHEEDHPLMCAEIELED